MLTKNQIKELVLLHKKSEREKQKRYIVEGEHLVTEALKANDLLFVITTDMHYKSNVPVHVVEPHILSKLSQVKTPQKVLGVCAIRTKNIDFDAPRVLALENIQDPGNLGTMIRTAIAFGYRLILLSKDCVDLYNEKVIRSTQGGHFHISIAIVESLTKELMALSKTHEILLTDLSGEDVSLVPIDYKNTVLVMGNEGNGISNELKQLPFKRIKIPMNQIDSLNVGVAAGILMYQFKS